MRYNTSNFINSVRGKMFRLFYRTSPLGALKRAIIGSITCSCAAYGRDERGPVLKYKQTDVMCHKH